MNSPMLPLVSIIIPSFNQGKFIRETIESCLNQEYRPIEILVMDGGSKDETIAVLKSFDALELQWFSAPDKGVVDAANKGMALAKGEILTIQSSDDVFLPGAIAAVVETLLENPDSGIVYGDVELIDENSKLIGKDVQGGFDFADYLGRLQYIPQPGTCFTRTAMLATGQWRDDMSYAADADFWIRIATKFQVIKIDRLVARYRYHSEQRDTQQSKIARDWSISINDLLGRDVLDRRLKRYARMGMHLAHYRYAAKSDWKFRTRQLYAAVFVNPLAALDPRFPKRELLPGREPLWAILSRIKRSLGFKPR